MQIRTNLPLKLVNTRVSCDMKLKSLLKSHSKSLKKVDCHFIYIIDKWNIMPVIEIFFNFLIFSYF